jgi:hypothetical protein
MGQTFSEIAIELLQFHDFWGAFNVIKTETLYDLGIIKSLALGVELTKTNFDLLNCFIIFLLQSF